MTYTLDFTWVAPTVAAIVLTELVGAAYTLATTAIVALIYMAAFTWRVRRDLKSAPPESRS